MTHSTVFASGCPTLFEQLSYAREMLGPLRTTPLQYRSANNILKTFLNHRLPKTASHATKKLKINSSNRQLFANFPLFNGVSKQIILKASQIDTSLHRLHTT